MPLQTVVKDSSGRWIPEPEPEVIQDPATGIFRYKDPRLQSQIGETFYDPVSKTLKNRGGTISRLVGQGSFENTPGWLNLPYKEQLAFLQAETERRIKSAKKNARFDKFYGAFLSVWSRFFPPVVGTAVKRGVSHYTTGKSLESSKLGITESISRSKQMLSRTVERERAFKKTKQQKASRTTGGGMSQLIYNDPPDMIHRRTYFWE
jgi:hypothetical protein